MTSSESHRGSIYEFTIGFLSLSISGTRLCCCRSWGQEKLAVKSDTITSSFLFSPAGLNVSARSIMPTMMTAMMAMTPLYTIQHIT